MFRRQIRPKCEYAHRQSIEKTSKRRKERTTEHCVLALATVSGRMSSANGRWSSRRHREMTKDATTTTTTTIPRTIPSHVQRRVLGRGVGRAGQGRRMTRRCPSRRHRRDGQRGRGSPGGGWAVRRGRRMNGTPWVRGGENPHRHYRRSSPRTMRASLLNRHRRRKMRGMDLFSSSSSQREVSCDAWRWYSGG